MSTGETHPIHGGRGHARAAAGASRPARRTRPAVDLEWDEHTVTRLDRAHLLADREYLSDAFVSEMQRQHELCRAKRDRAVQIACGAGDRVHNRSIRTGWRGSRHIPPAQPRARGRLQRSHTRTSRLAPLTDTVANRGSQPAQALLAVALQQHRHGRRGVRCEKAGVMAQRSTWTMTLRSGAEHYVLHGRTLFLIDRSSEKTLPSSTQTGMRRRSRSAC